MATVRSHVEIKRKPEQVWQVLADSSLLTEWFPGVVSCTLDGDVRHLLVGDGIAVAERIVTSDPSLRRLQYQVIDGPVKLDHHLATVDVLGVDGGSLVVYSADVAPDEVGSGMQQMIQAAVQALKLYVER